MFLFNFSQSKSPKSPNYSGAVIGMIGGGKMSAIHSYALKNGFDNVQLKAVASRSIQSANKIKDQFGYEKAYTDYKQMLDDNPDINAVIIAVSHEVSAKVLADIIPYKKYILAEKPAAFSTQENEELIALNKLHGSRIMVAVNRRFYTMYNDAFFDVVRRGGVGLMQVDIHEPLWDYRGRRQFSDWLYSRWPVANSIHFVDLIRYFGGDLEEILFHRQSDKYNVQAHLKLTKTECVVNSIYNSSAPSGFKFIGNGVSCEFMGSNTISRAKKTEHLSLSDHEVEFKPGIYGQMNYFLNALVSNNSISYPASSLEDHGKSIQLVEQLYHSVNV